jgi:hypothetical protein
LNVNHPARRSRAYMHALGITQLHLRNPWVVAFFSFSFPGFGHLLLERYFPAFILISWEVFINHQAHVNLAILYSLLGEFDKAKAVLDKRWILLYVSIYIYTIWDSYRRTVDLNNQFLLADREDAPLTQMKYSPWDINYLDKRTPWVALVWSILAPGLGHMYVHKMITGFFIFGFTTALMYLSHIPPAIHYSLIGHFEQARHVLNMQWTLYLPSMYSFIFYDAYVSATENNKLFKKEQFKFLRMHYQSPSFRMPAPDR